jgi:AhpD family alkylhydroperoxidase
MEGIEHIKKVREETHTYLLRKSKVYPIFLELENKAFSSGSLDKKNKELIAVGISIAKNCESCMEWHIKQALECGAEEDEIIESIEIGIEMSGGPGTVAARFAVQVLAYYLNQNKR